MILIADSNSSVTEWVVVQDGSVIERAVTNGINPYFQTRREISHIVRLQLPESFFRYKFERVYFYGSGCANPERNKIVEMSLVAQFRAPIIVDSNLMGVAHGLLQHDSGIACILSVGANSGYYDGNLIRRKVRTGGYLLGDEGSNAYLGKILVSDILKELAPSQLISQFYNYFNTDPDQILDKVYTQSNVNLTLSNYSVFLQDHLDHPYCCELVYDAFMAFFNRNVTAYDYHNLPIVIVGDTAHSYREILTKVAINFGATISKIEPSSLQGLVLYHSR